MLQKIQRAYQLINNMGWRYIFFRTGFELKKRTGLLKQRFPLNPAKQNYYTLEQWKRNVKPFFFESQELLSIKQQLTPELEDSYKNLSSNSYPFFSNQEYNLGADFDWMTNIDTGFKYNKELHWIDINDFDKTSGDIKYVWEPSRFSHLYTIIRYDKHSGNDCAEQVFSEIMSWIRANRINQGPNFKCSQEISLRVLNWTFALNYYKNSAYLTEEIFSEIQYYMYWQISHVYENINFSRIAVRNNHAITETLALYLIGLLFPDFPESKKWKIDGKRWFEQEIAYQVYEDGTFLQFSMNYHRVVIQLLTWAIGLSEKNQERFSEVVYDRAEKSLRFLTNCLDKQTGWLPNYGNNDGALFFKLNDAHYRDYRPQLEALSEALGLSWKYGQSEDSLWYGNQTKKLGTEVEISPGIIEYKTGGYYLFRQSESFTFIRCGNHKDRPAQADNLHLDLWLGEKNILHDGGTYKYNSTESDLKYFMGTGSHNTVMLDGIDQMEKGARFIWYHWTQCKSASTEEREDYYEFKGVIHAFKHIHQTILHERHIKIFKREKRWEVVDFIKNKPAEMMLNQIWHTQYPHLLQWDVMDEKGQPITADLQNGYKSDFYGKKEKCDEYIFSTKHNSIKTNITIK